MEIKISRSTILGIVLFLLILHFTYFQDTEPQPQTNSGKKTQSKHKGHGSGRTANNHKGTVSTDNTAKHDNTEKRAYATYLSTRVENDEDDDPYFTATRVLAYQILHQPSTRTRQNISFLVLVPPHVSLNKTKILAEEGATIVPVPLLEASSRWTTPKRTRFADQFTKLRLWGMTQYDRILYLDADMLLTKSLDDIWNEPVARDEMLTLTSGNDATTMTDGQESRVVEKRNNRHDMEKETEDENNHNRTDEEDEEDDSLSTARSSTSSSTPSESSPSSFSFFSSSSSSSSSSTLPPMPSSYLLASVSDTGGSNHAFPPDDNPYLNGGFFLLKPSLPWLNYYIAILNTPGSFNSEYMEQSLLNHVHRSNGLVPWSHFPAGKWNVNWPSVQDVEGGAASLHDKFWDEGNKKWIDRKLVEMWWRTQGRMEGFWQARKGNRKSKKTKKVRRGMNERVEEEEECECQ